MFDPLGLNKDSEPGTSSAPSERGVSAQSSPRLWLSLLIVDVALVVVFGGLLAGKIYQHLSAPAPAAASTPRRATKTEPKAAPAPTPPKPAEPPKPSAPEPPKAETLKTEAPSAKPLPPARGPAPKPSLVQGDAPPRASAAPLMGAAASKPLPQPAPAADANVKAVPVEFKLRAPGAKTVQLAGAFLVHGGRKAMASTGGGLWELTLYLKPGTYRYTFLVNGKKKLDPDNSKTDRGASVIVVTGQ